MQLGKQRAPHSDTPGFNKWLQIVLEVWRARGKKLRAVVELEIASVTGCHAPADAARFFEYNNVMRVGEFSPHDKPGKAGTDDDDRLLTKLTEAMCLRLREAVVGQVSDPIKIFLSHAKADGTEVPKQIKNFIQTETQCHSFFDENDINYGQDFARLIAEAEVVPSWQAGGLPELLVER